MVENGILAPRSTPPRGLSRRKPAESRPGARAVARPEIPDGHLAHRGLDLAASRATLAALGRAADAGGAVLLVTSDLDEARAVGDVLHVLYRGELAGPFPPDTGLDRIGRAMAGLAA